MSSTPRTPQAGEVWYVDFDPQVGREQAGIRPALVLSNGRFNRALNGLIIAAPITGTDRGVPVHLRVEAGTGGLTKTSFILCDQTGAFSDQRFLRYRGEVDAEVLLTARQIAGRFIDAHLIHR
ncbi:MAG: type II toxin-antitoxin system PemK/MazF family toxin [Thermomicrobiales bacterium]